ncbi:TetR/AcrR family transcriptional regulator [Tsukamurella paurometabola]|uniref:TetR/AcrR family transcriptional regulator n=1 Tax=Tsukamurella paurometabola TaxID=2061 RepID=A0ABS5N9D7_TSUPA|nr:TetR/AcrR family transcriptional regulator [Tsukamurella paurometabola]MBS4100873.1 TetR/AcrR family transcriptional regulator [Tsukamurella paurometabola]
MSETRQPLSRGRVVAAAVGLADGSGLSAATMRAVAGTLDVEAMSLYNHVRNRADLLDGMVDAVFAEIPVPADPAAWRDALREVAHQTRAALQRHPWAIGMLDSRATPGPATLRRHDAVLGLLLEAGFSASEAVQAVAVLDSYVYGSALTEKSLPVSGDRTVAEAAADLVSTVSESDYPHLVEVARARARDRSEDSYDAEFGFGLDLILDGLHPGSPS